MADTSDLDGHASPKEFPKALVKDRALEVLSTLQGNEEEGPMMGEYIGLNE